MRRWLASLAAFVILATLGFAPAQAERRLALVVGNSGYQHAPALTNPANDAADMTAALKAAGFEVIDARNADKRRFDGALRTFADKLAQADVALFFYAGHGLQVGLQNYLVPIDAKLDRERDLEFEAVKLDFVLRQMEIDREGKTTIVILDACRDNPLSRNLARSMGTRSTAIGRGLAAASTGLGTFIAYATQPGNVALDGEGTRNSPFTNALLKHMRIAGRNLPATMIEVRKDVVAATNGRQVPWDHSALTGDFYFVPGVVASTPANSGPSAELLALQERLKKLEENAQRSQAVAAQSGAASSTSQFVVRSSRRIEGNRIASSKPPNFEDCEKACSVNSGCIGYHWGKPASEPSASAPLTCELFDRVASRENDANWISAVRSEAISRPTAGSAFIVREGRRIEGDVLPAPPSTANCETRCQTEAGCVGWHLSRDGICELFSRVANRAEDPRFKSGVRPEAGAGASGGAAATASPVAATSAPIVIAPPILPRGGGEAPSLNYSLEENVRIDGNRMSESRQPNPDACRRLCASTAGCIAYQHGKKIPVSGQCQLFDRVDQRQEDLSWRSGVQVAAGNAPLVPPALLFGTQRPMAERGFTVYDNSEIEGEIIKSAAADSRQSCGVVCRNTPRCVAARYTKDRGRSEACTVFRSVTGGRTGVAGSTALFKTDASAPAN